MTKSLITPAGLTESVPQLLCNTFLLQEADLNGYPPSLIAMCDSAHSCRLLPTSVISQKIVVKCRSCRTFLTRSLAYQRILLDLRIRLPRPGKALLKDYFQRTVLSDLKTLFTHKLSMVFVGQNLQKKFTFI